MSKSVLLNTDAIAPGGERIRRAKDAQDRAGSHDHHML